MAIVVFLPIALRCPLPWVVCCPASKSMRHIVILPLPRFARPESCYQDEHFPILRIGTRLKLLYEKLIFKSIKINNDDDILMISV